MSAINNSSSHSEELAQLGAAVALSLGFSQIAGSLVIITQVIASVANCIKIAGHCKQLVIHRINERQFRHLSAEKLRAFKNHVEGTEIELRNSIKDLKQNMHRIAAGILCLLPVVGLIAASAYLSITDKLISTGSKVEMRTAALAKLFVGGGPLGGLASKILPHLIYPISGNQLTDDMKDQNARVNRYLAEEIKIQVNRGDGLDHKISCYYKSPTNDPAAKTMILFHGNGMIGSEMEDWAQEHILNGWNVLMVTMGGYPGSDAGVKTNETSTIQDVKAVLETLKKFGVKEIGVHGYSIGGTLASHAMKLEPELVKLAILERTLSNGPEVMANMLTNVVAKSVGVKYPKIEKFLLKLSRAIVWGASEGLLNKGREVPGVPGYFTDGLDNREKVKGFKNTLVAIGGKDDDLMGLAARDQNEVKHGQKYMRNFSHELAEAHQSAQPKAATFHHLMSGGHVGEVDYKAWRLIKNAPISKPVRAAVA